VLDSVFGPNGYVQTFDATVEQHCESGEAAARGEVHIAHAPPPELDLQLGVASDGTASAVSGAATVHGTVSCNKPTTVNLSGTVVQVVKKSTLARGSFFTQLPCTPDAPAAWTATASPGPRGLGCPRLGPYRSPPRRASRRMCARPRGSP
jgi:hypothetical protein